MAPVVTVSSDKEEKDKEKRILFPFGLPTRDQGATVVAIQHARGDD
jgi:hypothetical protein